MTITYLTGDATLPAGNGPKIIAHVCNDVGAWGSGFVLALTRRWHAPERAYRAWHKLRTPAMVVHALETEMEGCSLEMTGDFGLGQSQLASVSRDLYVLSMIAQRGLRPTDRIPAVRYDALALCLRQANRFAQRFGASLHMPRIGCGLGGGSWSTVGPLIERFTEVPVTVYDLPAAT